ncbi:MAG: ATP-dependent DNA helicase RecG [Phenylobacterium sp.]|jgi:ATP-dependent DNA helicase RecG
MPITPEQIDIWRSAASESQKLEFKEAKKQFDNKKLYKYCVALANEGGGHLLLGIADKLPRNIVGSQAFGNIIDMAAKLFKAVGFRVDIEEVLHLDGRVVVFSIPSRPKGTAYHYEGAYLMRSGEELVAMSEDHLRKIFAEGQKQSSFESQIALAELEAADVITLLDTQAYFELIQMPYPVERAAVLDRFLREKLVEAQGGHYAITNLGALLFAKNLDDYRGLFRKAVRVTTYDGNSKLKTKRDLIDKKGYATGFGGFIDYIESQLPANEVIGKALRDSVTMYPLIAIRELVANALIHQDLDSKGNGVSIDIYDNRIEISNYGLPSIEPNRFIDEYQSRNEHLADLMRRLRICEEKGSGIDKVISHVESCQLPPPDIHAGQVRTMVTLFAYRPFGEMDSDDKLRACYQHCVLRYILAEKMSNQSLRERLGLTSRQSDIVSRIVSMAVDEGLIKLSDPTNNSRRYAKYIPYWA